METCKLLGRVVLATWTNEYMTLLQTREKWQRPCRNFRIGDIVLVKNDVLDKRIWPKARVVEVFPDQDGIVRTARRKTATSTYIRDVRKLCLLEADD